MMGVERVGGMRSCDEAGIARMSNESVLATIAFRVVLTATGSLTSVGDSTVLFCQLGSDMIEGSGELTVDFDESGKSHNVVLRIVMISVTESISTASQDAAIH